MPCDKFIVYFPHSKQIIIIVVVQESIYDTQSL